MGVDHCLPLFHMSKIFYLYNKEERINDITIAYMDNPTLRVNKAFKEQVEQCMNDTFGAITQNFI